MFRCVLPRGSYPDLWKEVEGEIPPSEGWEERLMGIGDLVVGLINK